ncbi:hypothetical protein F4777DRAFT_600832 [Nemania sp. FL0916]|nr:hypothetical protein F4777DRAFT_600832 [Nemania sp. FL0916]
MPIVYPVRSSSAQGQRIITHRLFKKLKYIQAEDSPIPNPTVLEIKFYLKPSRLCRKVFIEKDNCSGLVVSLEHFPLFITSQLETQRIADEDKQSVQLATVLVVLSEHFVADPVQFLSVPTLFFWRDTGRQRTCCLFAYLDEEMEARSCYTAGQLLAHRHPEACRTSVEVLAKLKESGFGNVTCKDKSNGDQTHQRIPQKPREAFSSSIESEEMAYGDKSISTQSIRPQLQWKYRGRTGHEVMQSEPISAPAGQDKQSSEGFQRFFKAVVSPTHVRVTAGGRIVPNTRTSVSPSTKWDKERPPASGQNPFEPTKETIAEPASVPANNPMIPPMAMPLYQPQPMLYQPMSVPMPFYHPMQPMQDGMQHQFPYPYGFAPLAAPVPNTQYLAVPEASQSSHTSGRPSNGENTGGHRHVPATNPTRDQSDQNTHVYSNGQLTTHHMPQNGNFAPGAVTANAARSDPRMAVMRSTSNMPSAAAPGMPHLQSYSGAPVANFNSQPLVAPCESSAAPLPLSSIRPSEITRKQLEQLKQALKYWCGQLKFNKHQIDEPWVFAKAQETKNSITQFEHTLEMQLQFEAKHYPNMEPTPRHIAEMRLANNTPSRPSSMRHTQTSGSSHHDSIRSAGPPAGPRYFQPQQAIVGRQLYRKPNRTAVGVNATKGDNSTAQFSEVEAAIIQKLSAPNATPEQKAMLEAITKPYNSNHDPGRKSSSSKDSLAQPELLDEENQAQGLLQPSGMYAQYRQGETVQPSGTYLADANTSYMASVNKDPVPYLVGSYPQGTDPWSYQECEFVYGRELTQAEKQARHNYWGKLPSKGTGLPKFDGKDFYPASPQKVAENKGLGQNLVSGRGFNYELRRSDVDPFRSSRDANSIRSYESGRKLSKAIPIVAPPDLDKKPTDNTPAMSKANADQVAEDIRQLNQSLEASKLSSPGQPYLKYSDKKKSPPLRRRALERSSIDLLHNMLRKGSTTGNALPGAISSTNATGYLPQYAGNAMASFGPTIANSTPTNPDDKLVELEGSHVAVKTGENCPPSSAASLEHDVAKDLYQRMLRDAERRGVIGSDWQ